MCAKSRDGRKWCGNTLSLVNQQIGDASELCMIEKIYRIKKSFLLNCRKVFLLDSLSFIFQWRKMRFSSFLLTNDDFSWWKYVSIKPICKDSFSCYDVMHITYTFPLIKLHSVIFYWLIVGVIFSKCTPIINNKAHYLCSKYHYVLQDNGMGCNDDVWWWILRKDIIGKFMFMLIMLFYLITSKALKRFIISRIKL